MWLVAWCFERARHEESAAETVDFIKSTLCDMGPRVKLRTLNQHCQKELLKFILKRQPKWLCISYPTGSEAVLHIAT